MSSAGLGLGFAGLKLGTMAHGEDIRMISNFIDDLCHLSTNVKSYTTENALTLNCEKCELLITIRGDVSQSVPFPIVSSLKTLGTRITSDLSSKCQYRRILRNVTGHFLCMVNWAFFRASRTP